MRLMPWEFDEARCKDTGVELFFHKDNDDPERIGFPADHYKQAKRVCDSCKHKIDCALWGIENEVHGMWGGKTPKERKMARRGKNRSFTGQSHNL